MTTMKHTPGPWEASGDSIYRAGRIGVIADRVAYCHCGEYLREVADARLIAAAPDLLEALEAALAYLVMAGTDHAEPTRATIREAIAKARQ